MRNLLRVMGFWIWGLLAIGLAASVAHLGYRWATHFHSATFTEPSPGNGALSLHYVYLALSQLERKEQEAALQTFSSMLDLHLDESWRKPWQMYVEKLAKSAVQNSAGN